MFQCKANPLDEDSSQNDLDVFLGTAITSWLIFLVTTLQKSCNYSHP